MNTEEPTTGTGTTEDWTLCGPQLWKFQTPDGYLGSAYWRIAGAAVAVTRPDGTDLYKKTWGSKEIFPAAWPGMLEWLKGHVQRQVVADRVK
jgi:hypothetical protein